MNIAYVMRGVPGSGKSTVAARLAGSEGRIHSTDRYFYQGEEYRFDRSRIREFHDLNFKAFCDSLEDKVPVVICDNTNAQRWEFERYIEAAQRADYIVAVVTLPHPSSPELAAQRSVHGVTVDVVRQMMKRWEA